MNNKYTEYSCKFDNIDNFELEDTFTCGQCFRWKKEDDGSYMGVINKGLLNIKKDGKTVVINGFVKEISNEQEFISLCRKYLDLDRDYDLIQKKLIKDDDNMKMAIEEGKGIRILNQDPWEMLISFIISAANNIPRISKTIENISIKYGEEVHLPESSFKNLSKREFYTFPTPQMLCKATMQDLRDCNLGFRDKYVYNATQEVSKGAIDLGKIKELDYEKAKKELSSIQGVGSKVADCILLFSMEKTIAFPVDTWIKKVMNELYIESKDVKKINLYAINKFGEYAGIAQQYLFYYMRNRR